MTPIETRAQVVQLLKSIETGDPAAVAVIHPECYVQHNLAAADGLAGFGALLQALPPHSAKTSRSTTCSAWRRTGSRSTGTSSS